RDVARRLSSEMDLAGIKMGVNLLLTIAIVGAIAIFILISAVLTFMKIEFILAFFIGIGCAAFYITFVYVFLEYFIDKRKSTMEEVLPDFLQITSANLR